MNEQRYIRWKTTSLEGGLFALQIVDQSHIGWEWTSSTGFYLNSKFVFTAPSGHVMQFGGLLSTKGNHPIILTADQLTDCERALTEYNFAHSQYSKEWEIDEEQSDWFYFYDHMVECGEIFDSAKCISIRRKQPPVPTGEACVGCLCWVWDSEDRKCIGVVVVAYKSKATTLYRYKDTYDSWWKHAVPLTTEEVEAYLFKSKEAWKK